MIVSIADTHTAIWYLFNDPRLSPTARQFIERTIQDGNQVGVSSISLAEIVYLCEKGRIPASAFQDLIQALFDSENALQELPVTALVAQKMQAIPREQVSDLPDRIVAATALHLQVPVISRDHHISASFVKTVW